MFSQNENTFISQDQSEYLVFPDLSQSNPEDNAYAILHVIQQPPTPIVSLSSPNFSSCTPLLLNDLNPFHTSATLNPQKYEPSRVSLSINSKIDTSLLCPPNFEFQRNQSPNQSPLSKLKLKSNHCSSQYRLSPLMSAPRLPMTSLSKISYLIAAALEAILNRSPNPYEIQDLHENVHQTSRCTSLSSSPVLRSYVFSSHLSTLIPNDDEFLSWTPPTQDFVEFIERILMTSSLSLPVILTALLYVNRFWGMWLKGRAGVCSVLLRTESPNYLEKSSDVALAAEDDIWNKNIVMDQSSHLFHDHEESFIIKNYHENMNNKSNNNNVNVDNNNNDTFNNSNNSLSQQLFIIGLMVANKFLDDSRYSNRWWAKTSHSSSSILSAAELEFLTGIQFHLSVPSGEYLHWVDIIQKFAKWLEGHGEDTLNVVNGVRELKCMNNQTDKFILKHDLLCQLYDSVNPNIREKSFILLNAIN